MDLSALRADYTRGGLRRADLAGDPMEQFARWFAQAQEADVREPNAMALATADAAGQPSLRTVLMKEFDARGVTFFTNYASRKARELEANPQASALFMWLRLERQVAVVGAVEKVSTEETARYFAMRPRGSQLGAWASPQSGVVESRAVLEQNLEEVRTRFNKSDVPPPEGWGGFRLVPRTIEFWQGGRDRLHDRFRYTRGAEGRWQIDRVAP